ncbi:carbohydrate kinase family protein [Rhizomonospora bruguierae]|uniref:carbohydrate kinase family protein n=1 Tax=Rhizomonospora bruguierae TaxID=1581705 RepID=UPI001BCE4651|nr:carbohydrate kinase [Micromonospora sp. NBRC 107566]
MSRGILVVGEALVDVVRAPDGSVREHPGGSPANVALGLARLGRRVHLLTRTGDDPYGALLREHLRSAGVALVGAAIDDAPTATATAVLDAAGAARYEFELVWRLPSPGVPGGVSAGTVAVHTGSIAAYLEPGAGAVEAILRELRGRSTISYDPNVRPALVADPPATRARIDGLVAASDVVKVSDEDLAWLVPGRAPERVAAEWLARGPSLVVVTRGGAGAFAVSRSGAVTVPGWAVTVVDTVGAGDAFTSGLLDALAAADLLGRDREAALRGIDPETLRRVIEHAVRVSAFVCARAGAQPPNRAELAAFDPR